jgi:lipopolysaccharide/colanic/teichoic acid biosynthesis glycosyltransferase
MESSVPHAADGVGVRVPSAPPPRRPRRSEQVESPRALDWQRALEVSREHGTQSELDVVPAARSEQLQRAVNLMIGLVGIALLSPLLILIALAVKVTSRGPIFYTQTRVGLDRRWKRTLAMHEKRVQDIGGAAFTIYKFRTMYVDAEGKSGAVWAVQNDPRVTPLGKYLRQFRLDELPQLINVIRGDMNIVGPRPERPSIVARLREDIKEYPYRHRVKPGITGLAQINQQYDSCLDDVRAKVRYDLEYLRRQSLVEDIRIMLRTVPSVILKTRGW